MNPKAKELYKKLKKHGLTPERKEKILAELNDNGSHDLPDADTPGDGEKTGRTFKDAIIRIL